MAAVLRLVALALLAGLALLGLAMGAETQKEFVLESDLAAQGELAASGAAGNLVILTAVPVALGATGCLVLLSRLRVRDRLLPAGIFLFSSYGTVLLGQSMWPYYIALPEYRLAYLTNSLLATNLDGLPSVLIGPLAPTLALLLLVGLSAGRLLGQGRPSPGARSLLKGQAAAVLLAAPFLALAAWGNLRLLLHLPDDRPGLGPYFVVLPAITLACLALLGLMLTKTWHLGTYVRNARLAVAVQESWQTLGRAEAALTVILAALALASSFLAPLKLPGDLELGGVLGVTLRVHTQMSVLLAIPLIPLSRMHRRVIRLFDEAPAHPATLDDASDPIAKATLVAGLASAGLAAVATFAIGPVLWGWVLALLPVAIAAAIVCGPRLSAPVLFLAALALWGIGNTVQATYDGSSGNATLAFRSPPGLLALWRTLGALLAATTLARLAGGLAGAGLAARSLAVAAGVATASVALLEMPLTAWVSNRPGTDAIAVGSIVASLDPPVRAIVHTVAAVLAVAAALLLALLHRPEWFARRPRPPVAVMRPKRAGQGAKTPA